MTSSILSTSCCGNIHTVGILYKEGLSIQRNGFAMAFPMLYFVLRVLGPFVFFVRTIAFVLGGMSMLVLIIKLTSLNSTKNVMSFVELSLE